MGFPGTRTGRSPVDRGRTGSEHHLITDATGIPLAVTLTVGNRDDVPRSSRSSKLSRRCAAGAAGPRRDPGIVLGERGYGHDKYRRLVRSLGVQPVIARRGTEHGSGLAGRPLNAGSWSARSPTRVGSADRDSAARSATTSTKPFRPSAARSSAGGGSSPYPDSIGTQ
ncbi:transposase [Streptomyces sp. NPDC087851]|uniref:transposase n=1 Tax=Streptomyces sp. NPDC087851 TaxID=3365810 RepID=UPI0038289B24